MRPKSLSFDEQAMGRATTVCPEHGAGETTPVVRSGFMGVAERSH